MDRQFDGPTDEQTDNEQLDNLHNTADKVQTVISLIITADNTIKLLQVTTDVTLAKLPPRISQRRIQDFIHGKTN